MDLNNKFAGAPKYAVKNGNGETIRETGIKARAFLKAEYEERESGYAEVWCNGECIYRTNGK